MRLAREALDDWCAFHDDPLWVAVFRRGGPYTCDGGYGAFLDIVLVGEGLFVGTAVYGQLCVEQYMVVMRARGYTPWPGSAGRRLSRAAAAVA